MDNRTSNPQESTGDVEPVAWLFECLDGPYKGEIDVHSIDGIGGSEELRVANFYSEPFPVVRLSEAASQLASLKADNDRLRKALGGCRCPRPCNHRPDDFTVQQCVSAGECGCSDGVALSHTEPKQ